MRIAASILACISITVSAGSWAQPVFVEPEWSVTSDERSCDVVGTPRSESELTKILFKISLQRRVPDRIVLYVEEGAERAPGTFLLGINGNPPLEGDLSWHGIGTEPSAWILLDDRSELMAAVLAGTKGVMRVGNEVIDLRELAPQLLAAEQCVRDVFSAKGIDLDAYPGSAYLDTGMGDVFRRAEAKGRLPTKTDWRRYKPLISTSDYPQVALMRGEEGTVRVALLVDADGEIERCVVMESASPSLDDATCDTLMSRAEIEPDTNEAGQPIPTLVLTGPIRWELGSR